MDAPTAFARNLRAGLRLALLRPLEAQDFAPGAGQLVAFALLPHALLALHDFALAGDGALFNDYALTTAGTHTLLLLFSALVLAHLLGAGERTADLALTILAALPLPTLAWLAGSYLAEPAGLPRWTPWAVPAAWSVLIAVRAAGLLTSGTSPARLLAAAALYALINHLPGWHLPGEQFFYATDPPPPRLDVEDTYYRQPELLRRARVAAQTPGRTDVYFVGYAPYAGEDVFLNEVLFAQRLFDTRFGTAGRSVVLVNNPATLEELPLANPRNLAFVLDGIAAAMDPVEDLLVMFMTSHGSEDARLAADFQGLAPNDLRAGELRRLLDEAGIRWRVLIISACFSGSFIEALRSPETLVLTASHAERQSFGCGHDGDFTYFGKALLDEALGAGAPLLEAFEQARESIARRERSEGLVASRPQIELGAALADYLRARPDTLR